MIAVARGVAASLDLRARLADLYREYDDTLTDGDLEHWPELFTEACVYKVLPRENFTRNLPIALIYAESRAMLADRVTALRETALFMPRIITRITGGVCLRAIENGVMRLTGTFALFQTLPNRRSDVFLCGRYHDRVVEADGVARFAERLCVYDSTIVPDSLIYPV